MANILVIRFSTIDDVAMIIPVIYSLATQYPQHQIMVLSRDTFTPLFEELPENVIFRGVDLRGEYAGLMGLGWLYKDLKEEKFEAIADFEDGFRSKYLRWRFRLSGIKVAHLDKCRKEMRKLVRRKHKIMVCQKSSFQRYAEVLQHIDCPIQLDFVSLYGNKRKDITYMNLLTGDKENKKWIGIAPFATHVGKTYPLSKQEQVIKELTARKDIKIFLFGGGRRQIEVLEKWANKFENVTCVAGKLILNSELALMNHLDVMLSPDSVNMRLASLVDIPVLTIWGATHPYSGLTGWNQPLTHAIQADLPCRPCSVSGNKACPKGDYACLQKITPEMVVKHIENVIDQDLK